MSGLRRGNPGNAGQFGRRCKQCNSRLVRRIDEQASSWKSRKHCDEICHMLRREEDRYAKHYGDRMVRK